MSAEERLQADEYEIQHYEFSSSELSEDFSELVKQHIKAGIENIEKTFLEENYNDDVIKKQIQNLHELYLTKVESPLKNFKDTTRQIFEVHPNVALESDEIYKETYTPEQISKLHQEVEALEKEFLKERLFLKRCKEQMEMIQKLKPIYEAANVRLKTVPSIMKTKENNREIENLLKMHQNHMNNCFDETSARHAQYYSNDDLFK